MTKKYKYKYNFEENNAVWLTRARSADDDPPVEGTLRAHEREEVLGEVRRHFIVLQQLGRTIAVQATQKKKEN
jgi:hypothetical protein